MSQYAHPGRPAYPSEQPFGAGGPPYRGGGSPIDAQAGKKHMQLSLAFGIIGIFFLPIVFAPLAIVQAGKAERLGEPSNAGRILGWAAIGYWVLVFGVVFLFFSLGLMAGFNEGFNDGFNDSYAPPA